MYLYLIFFSIVEPHIIQASFPLIRQHYTQQNVSEKQRQPHIQQQQQRNIEHMVWTEPYPNKLLESAEIFVLLLQP